MFVRSRLVLESPIQHHCKLRCDARQVVPFTEPGFIIMKDMRLANTLWFGPGERLWLSGSTFPPPSPKNPFFLSFCFGNVGSSVFVEMVISCHREPLFAHCRRFVIGQSLDNTLDVRPRLLLISQTARSLDQQTHQSSFPCAHAALVLSLLLECCSKFSRCCRVC